MTYLPKCLVIRKTPAERDRRGRQRRCLREPSTYLLRGISCDYGGSVVFERLPRRQEKRAGPARPSGAMRPGRPPGAGSVSRRRRPNARDGGGSADVCGNRLLTYYGGSVATTGDQFAKG